MPSVQVNPIVQQAPMMGSTASVATSSRGDAIASLVEAERQRRGRFSEEQLAGIVSSIRGASGTVKVEISAPADLRLRTHSSGVVDVETRRNRFGTGLHMADVLP